MEGGMERHWHYTSLIRRRWLCQAMERYWLTCTCRIQHIHYSCLCHAFLSVYTCKITLQIHCMYVMTCMIKQLRHEHNASWICTMEIQICAGVKISVEYHVKTKVVRQRAALSVIWTHDLHLTMPALWHQGSSVSWHHCLLLMVVEQGETLGSCMPIHPYFMPSMRLSLRPNPLNRSEQMMPSN